MTIKLEVGRTYTQDEWDDVIEELVPGDRYTRAYDAEVEDGGSRQHGPDRITVTHLAPRAPSWAGAKVVMDGDGDIWQRQNDRWKAPNGGTLHDWETVDDYAPITVLLDADGHIPPASLMEVNGASREDLRQALRLHRQAELHDVADRDEVDAILAALEGGR